MKLRPVVPEKLPDDLRKLKTFVVEVDALPGESVCSASYKGELGADDVRRATVGGGQPLRKLFSKGRREFFAAHGRTASSSTNCRSSGRSASRS